jgi:Protein of unknown function (DUF4012)
MADGMHGGPLERDVGDGNDGDRARADIAALAVPHSDVRGLLAEHSTDPTLPLIRAVPLGASSATPDAPVAAMSHVGPAASASGRVRAQGQRPWHSPTRRVPRLALLLAIWVVLFVSVTAAVASSLQVFQSLNHAQADAADAKRHLNALRALVPASAASGKLSDLAPLLTPSTLAAATRELTAANADFFALHTDLAPMGPLGVVAHVPRAGDALTAAELLADAGARGSRAGLLLLRDARPLLAYLNGGVFADGPRASPLTAATMAQLQADFDAAVGELDQAVAEMSRADLSAIPSSLLKPSDATLLHTIAARWSVERANLRTARSWLAVLPSLLGIGAPSKYLLEVMDSTELRPGGGFIGNYTVVTMRSGQVEPFTLQDVYLLDEPYLARGGYDSPVPRQYAWWPWPSAFGLRDSNLSPDFPTNAQLAMRLLQQEGGPGVQGVIAVTPTVVERMLQIMGPIPMPLYSVTVTSTNLVPLIEHYQLAVSPQTDLPASDQLSSPNKRFVALLGRALLEKLHGLSLTQQLAIGQTFLTDVQQKDVQLYLANQTSQALLAETGSTAAVPHTPGDAVTITDANDGTNKAGPFTAATYQDTVRLDTQGDAIHDLTITYRFHATDLAQLYGPDRYKTYLRVYAPPSARLTTLDGFHNILGADQINHSDLAWRQMWGGYVIVADGVSYTLHLVWTVPHAAVRDSDGHWHYTLDFQRQAGAYQIVRVSIDVPVRKTPAVSFTGPITSDEHLTLTY